MFGLVRKSELVAKDKEIVRIKAERCAVETALLGEIQELKAVYGYQMGEIEKKLAECASKSNRLHLAEKQLKKCQDSKAELCRDLYAFQQLHEADLSKQLSGHDNPLSNKEYCDILNPKPQRGRPKKDKP